MKIRAPIKIVTVTAVVAAIATPVAQADAVDRGIIAPSATRSVPVDFWNYDPRTGNKTSNSSPGVAPRDLARLYSVPSISGARTLDPLSVDAIRSVQASPDDWRFFRGTYADKQVDPLTAAAVRSVRSSPDDWRFFRGTYAEEGQVDSLSGTQPISRSASQPTVRPSASTDGGFQWADAGIGAASVLALVILVGAATTVLNRHRRRVAAL